MKSVTGSRGIILSFLFIILMTLPALSRATDMTSWYTDGASKAGPIMAVARASHNSGYTTLSLRLHYGSGGALACQGPLRAYIRMNGHEALVPLVPPIDNLSDWNVYLANDLNSCGQWGVSDQNPHCEPLLRKVRDLFFYAVNGDHMNALDIDVAIVNAAGQWDSNYGANYHLRIGPLF